MMQIPNSRLLKIIALIWVFIQADPGIAFGQKSRKQLEKEKRENLRKLEQTNQILKEVKKEKKASISELNVLKQQTRLKDRKINTIHEELGLIQTDISLLETEQNQLTLNLVNIKKEYAAMVYAASKASTTNQMMYLFASETFNQFWMRLQYLRFYSDARRKQVAQMSQVKQELVQKQSKLAEVKVGKEVLLTTEEQEKRQLELLKSDKDKVVNELAMRESELRDRIDKQKESVRRLERMLSDLVAAEIRKSRRYNGPPNPNESDDGVDQRMSLTPEGKLISKSFAGNKNKLAWPVQNGFISTGFGRHEHAVLKRIYVDNLGIDISTKPGEKVRSVFEGTVGMVGQVPGMEGQIVMLRHGEYFTVYSGLKNVTVNTGEKIKMKQVIGEVIRDDEDGAILQFQVWKNSKRLDPEDWLAND